MEEQVDTATTLGLVGLAAVGIIAVLAWLRRRPAGRPAESPRLVDRTRSLKLNKWFGDPLLFTGDAADKLSRSGPRHVTPHPSSNTAAK
jgi:hypothetical protein